MQDLCRMVEDKVEVKVKDKDKALIVYKNGESSYAKARCRD